VETGSHEVIHLGGEAAVPHDQARRLLLGDGG
jgi:hypothetical protein